MITANGDPASPPTSAREKSGANSGSDKRKSFLSRKSVRILLALCIALAAWRFYRPHLRPAPAPPDEQTLEHLKHVRILRDTWGVPHVFGHSDADAAFGLAYAHAEDDWPTLQNVMAATRGQLGLVVFGKFALTADYYTNLIGVSEAAAATYPLLEERTRQLLLGYTRGLNYYAYKHPQEVDTRLLPITPRDVVAGFFHKISIMVGVAKQIEKLGKEKPMHTGEEIGSNAQAVHRQRSSDDVTRLNINSHQPWEGPVTWYEAHVVSDEGWNMTGGTFPGAPLILHGHNDYLGWAHTVNSPDLVDVFELVQSPEHPDSYLFEGQWLPFERKEARLVLDTGFFNLTLHKEVLSSRHGPALKINGSIYAFRWAGMDRAGLAVEEWYRMNKAKNLAEWRAAMEVQGIPMFHTVYADRDNIYYVYNALLPRRTEGHDYGRILPGDKQSLLFAGYLPFAELPQVINPKSGFVQACNSTPFSATIGPENPQPGNYSPTFGIETNLTNRSRRSLALLSGTSPLSRADFETMKWDRAYDRDSDLFHLLLYPLLTNYAPRDADEKAAIELLRAWDGRTSETSEAASLAVLMFNMLIPDLVPRSVPPAERPQAALRDAIAYLKQGFGKVNVPLGELERLRRGSVDLPLGGGPDVLNAVYNKRDDGRLIGISGDSYVLLVEFAQGKTTSRSIHQYGASCRPASRHYNDQAPLFVARKLKPAWRSLAEIRQNLEREYVPGQESAPAP